eukprot:m.416378 g.416378  ORF g.416378 m.416378 type:complete len:350 (+) comp29958_c0_seq1:80-1129(+)
MWAVGKAVRVATQVGQRGMSSGSKSAPSKLLMAAGATVVGGLGIVGAFGEPFATEVETKEVTPGAEYRTKGLAPRKNNNYEDESVVLQYLYRTRDRARRTYEDYIAESDVKVLLPAMIPGAYRQNGGMNDYSLVVDLDKTLVFTEFKVSRGFRTIKRPGVDFFLDWASKNFAEVILFSDTEKMDGEHLVTKLDTNFPNGVFSHLLWKGDMRTVDGELVKDVSRLNRNPARVITLDDDAKFLAAQPENHLHIAPFEGDSTDTVLVDLIPLLNALISSKTDVRENLPRWQGLENPGLEFTKINAAKWEQHNTQPQAAAAMPSPQAPSGTAQPAAPGGGGGGGYSLFGVRLY